jgi:leucyl aminopeptidase (aminopeptidase T)
MYDIIDREIDEAGKTRVRVAINGESIMFKFQSNPTDEEIQAEAARYDAMMQEQAYGASDPG